MMRFMHSHPRNGRVFATAGRGFAILIAAVAGGCSAEISRFDFPTFSLADDEKKEQQTAALQSSNGSPSYLGNEGSSSDYGRSGYSAPRSYSDSGVDSANLPDATPSQSNFSYANHRRGEPQPSSQPAPAPLSPGESVTVGAGDTLYGLSRRHGVSVAELMEVNGLNNPNLKVGQTLYLPQGYPAQPRREAPRTYAAAREPVTVPPAVDSGKYGGSHTMRSGESLYGISRSYGITVAELQQANGITDPRSVPAGTVLRVPGRGGSSYEPAPAVAQQVAVAPPEVPSTHQPRVINRKTQTVALPSSEDVSTGAISPPAQPRSASDKLRWPVSGRIISGFGQRSDGTHNDGINLSVPPGTSVHAAEQGTVAYAGSELKGYGNLILVRHDNGWVTAYAHNDQLLVKRGDKVQRGQVIAKAGRTGSVDQPQLHFELRQGSKPVDPVPFLERL